ncbi:MAG TPA: hypothetical protein VGX76_05130, partial [Pirellulales bacterium]|nr:hypothetical protein [Pirellulales bacterium]
TITSPRSKPQQQAASCRYLIDGKRKILRGRPGQARRVAGIPENRVAHPKKRHLAHMRTREPLRCRRNLIKQPIVGGVGGQVRRQNCSPRRLEICAACAAIYVSNQCD